MRYVELIFHERDARMADVAARGLGEAGFCVLRRPVAEAHAPAASTAAQARVLLHSSAFAALPAAHAVRTALDAVMTVAPLDGLWPMRASRPWLIAPPGPRQLESAAYWKLVASAAATPFRGHAERIGAQQALSRALQGLKPEAGNLRRRRQGLLDRIDFRPLEPVRGTADWERAVTPLAVMGTIAAAALVSAMVVDVAARPEAWGVIAQDAAPLERTTNAFTH
jgi:hypothetical protein